MYGGGGGGGGGGVGRNVREKVVQKHLAVGQRFPRSSVGSTLFTLQSQFSLRVFGTIRDRAERSSKFNSYKKLFGVGFVKVWGELTSPAKDLHSIAA
ncbi:Hypothetical predicted protein [Octopus vulgaris]|uniref:Uncharacterized protein n=1 Tax=Octopus vulgaris TaxID=6645 RepID=A0AA36AJJ2_OCTVU|nr:Hypothetical predicted protein [Octopus vulgaris]